MFWRKWLVRFLVFSFVGGLAAAGWIYQRWTNPAAVRKITLTKLGDIFVGADLNLDSAHMRLLGGIALSDLRMARKDDLDKNEFASVHSAVIYLDKEQLLGGKVPIRKVELTRPRLRILRTADGHWNLAGIIGPPNLAVPWPTVVVRHGTISLEDRQAAPSSLPMEIREVALTLLNDPHVPSGPISVVRFEGTGVVDVAGPVEIKGSYDRVNDDFTLTLTANSIPVGPALVQRLANYYTELGIHARQLEGQGLLRVDLAYHPKAPRPWTHEIRFELAQGKLTHARLPVALEQLRGTIVCVNGQLPLVQFQAVSGSTKFDLIVHDLTPNENRSLESLVHDCELKIDNIELCPAFLAALPEPFREIQHDYEPAGPIDLVYSLQRETNGQWVKRFAVKPRDAHVAFHTFYYPLEHVRGCIEQISKPAAEDRLELDLTGMAGNSTVYVKGTFLGCKPNVAITLDVWGDNIAIEKPLMNALSEKYRKLAESFQPKGWVNFRAYIRRGYNDADYNNHYLLTFHHASMAYAEFPYPLENLSGILDVRPDHFEFREFVGSHQGGEFRASGESIPGVDNDRLEINLHGNNILLDHEMRHALRDHADLSSAWRTLSPAGRLDFDGKVYVVLGPKETPPEIELTLRPKGCSLLPSFFSYALEDVRGEATYAARRVDLRNLSARHGPSVLTVDKGTVFLKPGGGLYVRLDDLRGSPLVPDADFLRAVPSSLRNGLASLKLKDPLGLKTLLVVDTPPDPADPPTIYWDGAAVLRDASIDVGVRMDHITGEVACRGIRNGKENEREPALPPKRLLVGNFILKEASLFQQPFQEIHSQFEIYDDSPDSLRFPGLHAKLYGGEVYGPIRVEMGPTMHYDLNLTASQIKLEEFGRHNLGSQSQLAGLAQARLYLNGDGSEASGIKGSGSLDVPSGKMLNLPVLLDLLKFLGLRLPDRTAFEEAHARFDVEGNRVQIRKLNLYGNSISIRGQGEMNLDGTGINMDLNVDWARLNQVLAPGVKVIPETISNQLLRINMKGEIGKVDFRSEIVPLLSDPLKKMRGGGKE